jgi:glycosyltransferase involved in cell wall biosynthesis
MPAIEAWANETVAIGGVETVLQETISDKSLLFNPNEVSSIASVISRVLSNDDLWKKSLIDSKKKLSNYTWTAVAQRLLKKIRL